MEKFITHTGVAAPMLQINIDTDAIIPSREMKRVSKQGLGEGLFAGWRYQLPNSREINPEFILNQKAYTNTTIILAGDNFGCGSSREHAVWALKEYGIKVIIAPGFGSIFYHNCVRNGILPVVLKNEQVLALAEFVRLDPPNNRISVDLRNCLVEGTTSEKNNSLRFSFSIKPAQQSMLLEGLDGIALTLQSASRISTFTQAYSKQYPWLV